MWSRLWEPSPTAALSHPKYPDHLTIRKVIIPYEIRGLVKKGGGFGKLRMPTLRTLQLKMSKVGPLRLSMSKVRTLQLRILKLRSKCESNLR